MNSSLSIIFAVKHILMNNKERFFLLAIISCLILFSSCMPELTESWINKDGSGKMEVTMDMGEMSDMALGMIESMGSDSVENSNGLWSQAEKMDSTLNFYAETPNAIKHSLSKPELLKKININTKIDSEEKSSKLKISIAYDSEEQFQEILEILRELEGQKSKGMMAVMEGEEPDFSAYFDTYKSDLKNGVIRVAGVDLEDLEGDPEFAMFVDNMDDPETAEDPEFIEMMKMMFGGEIKTIIHAPGKILFTSDMNATIDGNTVTFRDNILEILKSKKSSLERVIKYKI